MIRTIPFSLRLALPAVCLALHASAAVFTLNPLEDAFVSSLNPNSNYGGGGALSIASGSLPKGEFDSLLKFDLSSVKASLDGTFGAGLWSIQSITLQLTAATPASSIFNGFGAGAGGSNVNLAGQFSIKWMQNDAWAEGTGTPAAPGGAGVMFSTLPAFLSAADETLGTYSFNGASSGAATWDLNLTSAFRNDVTAGNAVSLLMIPADNAVAYTEISRNNPTVANRPVLTVTAAAVPEPTSGALMAGAGALLALCRRRGRN